MSRDTKMTPIYGKGAMTMKERLPFTLYRRTLKSGKKVYYSKFLNPDGTYTAGRSTGKTTKREAELEAWNYISTGLIAKKQNYKLKEYATNFFNWDNAWALNKRSAGKRISKEQCKTNQAKTDQHIIVKIGNLYLTEIDTATVKRLRNDLFRGGYSGSTINKVIGCLRAILETAEDERLLRHLPRFERSGLNQKERGILSQAEVQALFKLKWKDKRVYAGNLISASTGFRLSEVLGIKRRNIKTGYIEITGSWSTRDRAYKNNLKNGQSSRLVPIPESVQTIINNLLDESPFKDDESYLLYCPGYPQKPIEHIEITRGFYNALKKLDTPINDKIREARNITFHSHRHFFNSLLVESRIPLQKIQRLTGHLSAEMTQRYYHTNDLADVEEVTSNLFENIIPFEDKRAI